MSLSLRKRKHDLLISGSSSGLGKYLLGKLGGIPWTRQTKVGARQKLRSQGAKTIIHCAFNSERAVTPDNLTPYLTDNVLLTAQLIRIPHQKFIFISSVDVYPKNTKKHFENEVIDIYDLDNLYAVTKLVSEVLVRKLCPNFLILRCTALLGKSSRKNSLIKIIEDNHPSLTLAGSSAFNYILHQDVSEFIELAIKKDLRGVYNLASSKNITLSEVAHLLGKEVNFGNYIYNVGNIDNSKAVKILSVLNKSSQDMINRFLNH